MDFGAYLIRLFRLIIFHLYHFVNNAGSVRISNKTYHVISSPRVLISV